MGGAAEEPEASPRPCNDVPLDCAALRCAALQWEELQQRYPRTVYAGRLM